MSHSTKISGVNFPPGCPRDFADQVRMMVRRHNQAVEDLLTYEQTVRELQRSLNKSKTAHTELQNRYDVLKDVSEKLASKYEKLVSSRNGTLPRPSQSSASALDQKTKPAAKNTPQVTGKIEQLPTEKLSPAKEQVTEKEDHEEKDEENGEDEKEEKNEDDETLVEIETETS